ncbi:SDR family NAD(P)-dependent oxidoreductase [Dyadobacter psychrotolerans]|uniref:SDR family oxidoreductase n=1 Tax=Dyadobacter psychrotolerans TaxID=2541721 RepID=A0A4R5DKD6_9BACT|nr:SDR family oxidoreductase [Dyadobacter psychrotolerans]TDE14499.1 SDR family oxidoreductase [Dyadobacter psychrotolerans]
MNNKTGISSKTAIWTALGAGAFLIAKSAYRELTKYDLRGKIVLVTGGSRGLGLAIARELASKGAKIAICARNGRQLENAKIELEETGVEVLTVQADVSIQAEVEALMKQVINHFGRLDVLINNAGIIQVGPENVMEVEDYQTAMDNNLWAALYSIKAAVPGFIRQGEGRIVNICSIGGKIAVPHLLPYSVSKFALVGLSEGLSAELKKDNIHVTTVIPNLMLTGSPRNVSVRGDHEAEYAWFKVADSTPLISQKADKAAKQIVKAIEHGDNELVLTQLGKVMVAVQGLMPEAVTSVMQIANRFLPKSTDSEVTKKGYESESDASNGPVAVNSDRVALEYNEL